MIDKSTTEKLIGAMNRLADAQERAAAAIEDACASAFMPMIMASAPEPPSWFQPSGLPMRPVPPEVPLAINEAAWSVVSSKTRLSSESFISEIRSMQKIDPEQLPEITEFWKMWKSYIHALEAWERIYSMAKMGQWPSFYACMVIDSMSDDDDPDFPSTN